MTSRLPLNSQSLQEAFPNIYQDFFFKCPIVISCPRSFSWFGEQAVRYEGLILRQNLPVRTYVGLIPQKKKEVKIAEYLCFNPNLQEFQKRPFGSHQKEKIEKYFLSFLKNICNIELTNGFKIYILNELPHERGLGSGAFIVSLVIAVLILFNKLTPTEITKWENKSLLELQRNKTLKFDYSFRTIWKWENFIWAGASGSNLTSLMPSSTPILYCSKRIFPSQVLAGKELTLEELNFVDKNSYWMIRLDEIVKKPSGWPWQFDYGLIYTGEIRDIRDSINLIRELNIKLINVIEESKKDLDIFIKKENEQIPLAYKLCQNKNGIWYEYINTLIVNSLQNYFAFKKIFKQGSSPELLRNLAELLNKEQHLFYLLNLSSSTIDALCSTFNTLVKKRGKEDIIVSSKISGSTRRGDIVFLTNSYQIRDKIDELIEELRLKFGKEIILDYASWLDGYEEKGGVRIEQFWQGGIYSKYAPEESLILKEYTAEEKRSKITTLEKLKKEKFTLLLDALQNKIYVKGKKITSKVIPTQAATIEILKELLETKNKVLNNKTLPSFSYTKYRNEMQGKIATPLAKLTNGKIRLVLQGKLSDFMVKLKIAPRAKIGLLEKMK